jgi:hypothetical protein
MDVLPFILKNKYVRLGLIGLLALIVLLWLFHYLTTGQLTIISNDPKNVITVSTLSKSGSGVVIKQGQGSLSFKLRPGRYTIMAQNRVFETSRLVQVEARKKSMYELDIHVAGAVEPVLPTGAYDVIANGTKLLFVDAGSGGLYQVEGEGKPSLISDSVSFKSMGWADMSLGVGQGKDGHLYIYQNGGVAPLQVPFAYSAAVSYAVTRAGQIYISSGADVYAMKNGVFEKIYTAKSSSVSLTAGKDHLAIVGGSGSIEGQKNSDDSSSLTVVDADGHKLTKNIEASTLAWSPDDKHLAISSELGNTIYTSGLASVASYPGPSVNSLAWIDNNTLLYGLSGSLWSYNMETNQSVVIANTPLQGAVSDIYPSLDGNYVYITVAKNNSSTSYELDRVGLHGQNVPDYVLQLAVYFPKVLDDCSVSYVNFVKPVLLLQSNAGSQQICLSEANGELNLDGLNASKFQFLNMPLPGIWPY